jgi:tetratricopeptide (TPR) repeat protein
MKRDYPGFVILFLSFFLLWTQTTFGQKTIETEEKNIIQKFRVADVKFQKGRENFNKGKYDKAGQEFQDCLKVMPQHSEALFYLSQIEHNRGDFDQALTDIEKAKANFHLLGDFYTWVDTQRLDSLRQEKMKLQQQLGNLQTQLAQARSDTDKRKIQTSVESVSSQIKVVDSRLTEPLPALLKMPADYFYFHGNILFKLKKYEAADDQYLEAIKADPSHTNAFNNLINLHYMAKDYEGALKFLNQAEVNGVKINPSLKEAVLKAAGK